MSPKAGKIQKSPWDRNTQEQIRKRRHNLFRRIKEFHDRYDIETWCTMRMPSGQIYVFNTNPDEPSPPTEQMEPQSTIIHKTPEDYVTKTPSKSPGKRPPALPFRDLPCFVSISNVMSETESNDGKNGDASRDQLKVLVDRSSSLC